MFDRKILNRSENVVKIFDEKKELFIKKNANYGAAYVKCGIIMDFILEGKTLELKTPQDHMVYELFTRLLEKIIRFVNLRFTGEQDKVEESIIDTMGDISVQSIMIAELEQNMTNLKKKK